MSFSSSVTKWTNDMNDDAKSIHKAIIFELFSSVITDTPVLEGRLRGNWIISSDDPANGTLDVIDKSGDQTTKKVSDFLATFNGEKDFNIFLTNNLPYAHRIEYDGWSHTKAPNGMVRKNLIRISNNLKSA